MSKKVYKSVVSGTLEIGDIIIPCAVLEDGTRVISQRGVDKTLGRSKPSSIKSADVKLPSYLRPNALQPFIPEKLKRLLSQPIEYTTDSGLKAFGLKAELLPEVCDVWVQASQNDVLKGPQIKVAERAYILLKGFANIGIIALVDEATGYQDIRLKNALAKILEQYLDKNLHEWTKTFPIGFYIEIFRLRGWDWRDLADGKHRPMPNLIGKITRNIIYGRLPSGILEELEKRNPKNEKGNRLVKHHQWFNSESGHPKLKEHIASVTALMRASNNWTDFQRSLKRAFPKPGEQTELDVANKQN